MIPLLQKPNAKVKLQPMVGLSVANLLEGLVYHNPPEKYNTFEPEDRKPTNKILLCNMSVFIKHDILVAN